MQSTAPLPLSLPSSAADRSAHRGCKARGDQRAPEVVKSAVRVLQVLEFFDRTQMPASVGAVAAALCFPQSSTSALLRSLVKIGYLRYEPYARTYLPTERVPLLGSWIARPLFQGGPLLGLMDTLAHRLECAVVLGRRNGDHAQCVHLVDPGHIAPEGLTVGTSQSLAHSALGLMMLAAGRDEDARRLMHRMNANAEPQDVVRIPGLLARLAEARARAHALVTDDGHATLAVCLPHQATASPLVLGLVAAAEVVVERRKMMLTAAREEIMRWLRPAPARLTGFDVPRGLAVRRSHGVQNLVAVLA